MAPIQAGPEAAVRMSTQLTTSDLGRYMQELQRHPVLSPEQEQRLAIRFYEDGDVDAARQLVLGNLRFALKLALEYRRFAPVMDLVQEANLGLMEAVRRFNPYRGYRLITYAVWWIRAYLQRYVVESSSVVRRGTTRDQRKVVRSLGAARRELAQATGEEAGVGELAEAMGVDEQAVVAMTGHDLSLDVPLDADAGETTWVERLSDEDGAGPEEILLAREARALAERALADVLGSLGERDREILELRLLASEPATLQELADRFEISRERVRQLESGIRKKLAAAADQLALPAAEGEGGRQGSGGSLKDA